MHIQDGKKTDLKSKISQVRDGVLKQTSDIGSMKVDRDTTLTDIECSENEILVRTMNLTSLLRLYVVGNVFLCFLMVFGGVR